MQRNRRPSSRNLAIYQAVACEGMPEADVAREHNVSQQRISQICKQVEAYNGRFPDEQLPFLTQEQRAVHLRNERIKQADHQWRQAMREWRRSMETVESLKVATEDPTGSGAEGKSGKRKAEQVRTTRPGNVAALRLASDLCERLFKLKGGLEPAPVQQPTRYMQVPDVELTEDQVEVLRRNTLDVLLRSQVLDAPRLVEAARMLGLTIVAADNASEPLPPSTVPQAATLP